MKTVLQLHNEYFGIENGDMNYAQNRFSRLTISTMDKFCQYLCSKTMEIEDIESMSWFINHYLDARELHNQAQLGESK